jgi:hypothetical protein
MENLGNQVAELEHKVQALTNSLVDKWTTFNVKQKTCLSPLQQKLLPLQQEVKRKEVKTFSTINSRSCQKGS